MCFVHPNRLGLWSHPKIPLIQLASRWTSSTPTFCFSGRQSFIFLASVATSTSAGRLVPFFGAMVVKGHDVRGLSGGCRSGQNGFSSGKPFVSGLGRSKNVKPGHPKLFKEKRTNEENDGFVQLLNPNLVDSVNH